jgi:itaconyl-CoA hydratase
VNSCLTLALITGLSVPDTSEDAVANLSWTDVQLPAPVFVGDTLWAETEVLEVKPSRSNEKVGVVTVRSRGINQRGDTVISFVRSFMVHRDRGAVRSGFPGDTA